jgi:GTPase SAR1 family protein
VENNNLETHGYFEPMAMQLKPWLYSCKYQWTSGISKLKIITLGNVGSGKSATINSILNEKNASIVGALTSNATDAVIPFSRSLKNFNLVLIDTPGLLRKDLSSNSGLNKIKTYLWLTSTIDIVLFCTRLDIQQTHPNEEQAICTLTEEIGKDIWRRTIIVFTRACFKTQKCKIAKLVQERLDSVQRAVNQACGLCAPLVVFAENYRVRMKHDGQMVLPNENVWLINLMNCLCELMKYDDVPFTYVPTSNKPHQCNRMWFCLKKCFKIGFHAWGVYCLLCIITMKFLNPINEEDNIKSDRDIYFGREEIARNRESVLEFLINKEI